MLHKIYSAMFCVVFGCGIALADEDAIDKAIASAKDEFEKATEKVRSGLVAELKKKAETAQKAGDLKLLEKVEAEIGAFEEKAELPKSIPTKGYENELKKAKAKLEIAYSTAVKEYTKDGKRAKAKAAQQKLDELKMVSAATAAGRPFLVSEFPCPDPQVFYDGSDWYIFGTGARPFFLQGQELGEGKMKQVFLDLDYAGFPLKVAQIWGFVVHRHSDGTHHAYGTLHLGNFHTIIAYFEPQIQEKWEAGKPITKWKFKSVVVGDPSRQDWNYYESKILQDADKTLYLMYVARTGRDNFIYAQKMKSWREIDASAPRRLMLKPEGHRSEDRNGPGGMQIVEGGSIVEWKGKYILLYSVGDYLLNNYKLGMAFSNSLIPANGQTYHKVKIPDPKKVWGEKKHKDEIGYLLQSEKPNWPNYSGNHVVGPGLGSLVTIDKHLWLFFHGYKPEDKERKPENRFVFQVPVTLAIDGATPSLKWLHADLPDERIMARQRQEQRESLVKAFNKLLSPDTVWEGTSDWGQNKTTKSELRYVKNLGEKSEWEFVFLEGSIFNTSIPFRERWTGELVDNDKNGVLLRLTRHDGKAFHEYKLSENGDMNGKGVNTPFTYRFTLKK